MSIKTFDLINTTAGVYGWPLTTTAATGWTCPNCKGWVPNGCTHNCPSTTWPAALPAKPAPSADERIATALERIAAALEAGAAASSRNEPS